MYRCMSIQKPLWAMRVLGSNVQFNVQGFQQPVHSIPFGLYFTADSFVEAGTSQAGFFGYFGDSFVLYNVAKGNDKNAGVIILVCIPQIEGNFFVCLQEIVKGVECGEFHSLCLKSFVDFFSAFDVSGLGGFIASTKQDDDLSILLREVEPIALTDKDTHLTDIIANRFYVTQITRLNTNQTHGDRVGCLAVFQFGRSLSKNVGFKDFVSHWLYCIPQDTMRQFEKYNKLRPLRGITALRLFSNF